jgi:dephospho-CoA kinase
MLGRHIFTCTRFVIIDVDQIAHDIVDCTKVKTYGKDSAYYDIIRCFGSEILLKEETVETSTAKQQKQQQQQVDRKKLGDIIFRNPDKRRLLNQLTHTRIIRCMFKRIVVEHYTKPHGSVVLVDIPLLFEAGWWMKLLFGCIIVVATLPPSLQLKRLQSRNPELSTEQCQHRIDSQYPVESKVSKADLVIWNNDISTDELRLEVSGIRDDVLYMYSNWSRPLGCVICTWVYALALPYIKL